MPRPRPFTERSRREKREKQVEVDEATFRRAETPAAKIARDVTRAADLIRTLGIPAHRQREQRADIAAAISGLIAILGEVRWEWRSRREIIPDASLPVLGGVQPTHG